MKWTLWNKERPTDTSKVYRWQVSPRKILGKVLQPEWSGKLRLVGMGYDPCEYWPPHSHWDGYIRTVDPTLEWRIDNDQTDPELSTTPRVVWKGLDLLPCPFSGHPPKVEFCPLWCGAPPYKIEALILSSGVLRFGSWRDAQAMVDTWNRRV